MITHLFCHLPANDLDELGEPVVLLYGPGAAPLDDLGGVEAGPPMEHARRGRLAWYATGDDRPLRSCKTKTRIKTPTHNMKNACM